MDRVRTTKPPTTTTGTVATATPTRLPSGYLYPVDGTLDYAAWLRQYLAGGSTGTPGTGTGAGGAPVVGDDGVIRTRPEGQGPSANAYAHANPHASFLRALQPGYTPKHPAAAGGNPFIDAVIAEDEERRRRGGGQQGRQNAFAGRGGR